MPKKQNGFGKPDSFAFKQVNNKTDVSKQPGAAGYYPSNRRYGTLIQPTVIEKYNLDSDWTRWRKGYEYYSQGATIAFTSIDSVLYQGTADATPVRFTGERYATKNSDSRAHYTIKRTVLEEKNLGLVTKLFRSLDIYGNDYKYKNKEIWAKVEPPVGPASQTNLLKRCIGERVSDSITEANIINVMTTKRYPSTYSGKTDPSALLTVTITCPLSTFGDINPRDLVNDVVLLEDLSVERPISTEEFIDSDYFFGVQLKDNSYTSKFQILNDEDTNIPPELLDVFNLEPIVESSGQIVISGTYIFQKSDYQKYWGPQYLTADLVKAEVGTLSYSVLPFKILGIDIRGDKVIITSAPFASSVQLFSKDDVGYLIFNTESFTNTVLDTYDGEYYHSPGAPGSKKWMRMDTDVDPWMDEVFYSGGTLKFADIYACSCPDYLHAILRMPEARTGDKRNNRQRRIPLPSAQGISSYEQLGSQITAGTSSSWETLEYKTSHRMCKHSIAAHFDDKIKIREPKSYPTLEAREAFEKKLQADIKEVADEFRSLLERSEITAVEIVASLASALNLSEIDTANVIRNTRF